VTTSPLPILPRAASAAEHANCGSDDARSTIPSMHPAPLLAVRLAFVSAPAVSLCACVQDWDVGPVPAPDTRCDDLRATVDEALLASQVCTGRIDEPCYTDEEIVDACGCLVALNAWGSTEPVNVDYLRAVTDLKESGCTLDCPDSCPENVNDAWCTKGTQDVTETCLVVP